MVPQLVTSFDKGPGFEAAAHDAGADYLEVVLVVDADEHAQRLRSKRPTNEVEARVQTDLEDRGNDLISRIRQHLSEYLADRPETIRLETTGLTADATYRRLLDVIATDAAQRAH